MAVLTRNTQKLGVRATKMYSRIIDHVNFKFWAKIGPTVEL